MMTLSSIWITRSFLSNRYTTFFIRRVVVNVMKFSEPRTRSEFWERKL